MDYLFEELPLWQINLLNFQSTAPTCKQTDAELHYRKKDHLSHFILRLAYCRSDELRRWLIARELELFKLRFMSLNADEIREFLNINNLSYSPVSNFSFTLGIFMALISFSLNIFLTDIFRGKRLYQRGIVWINSWLVHVTSLWKRFFQGSLHRCFRTCKISQSLCPSWICIHSKFWVCCSDVICFPSNLRTSPNGIPHSII